MRRGPVILTCAVIALVAAVAALIAWRSDPTTTSAGPASTLAIAAANTATPSTVEAPEAVGATVVTTPAVPTESVTTAPGVASASSPTVAAPAAAGETTASVDPLPVVATVDGPAHECPATSHGAVVDRVTQRAWLCGDGAIVGALPITSAWSMPDPGSYPVYAKDLNATSNFGGHFSRMTHFVAFTTGERTGARIAFHSVPTLIDGTFVQALDSVGQLDERGESSGCIRVLPDDAVRIWEWLSINDEVHVIS